MAFHTGQKHQDTDVDSMKPGKHLNFTMIFDTEGIFQ